MKLLVFSPYYPPHIGGLESHSDEFNRHLSQKGLDITVFTPRLPIKSLEKEVRYNNVEIIRFPAFEIIPNYPLPKFWKFKFWNLFFSLYSKKFDIIISRTRFFHTSLLAMIYAKTKNIKWVHIEHGSDFVQLNNRFSSLCTKIYDLTLGRLILAMSDKNIANSIASADFCKKLARNKECIVVYRGVEIEEIEHLIPDVEFKNSLGNKIIIGFIGRLIDGKGVSDLLQALTQINNTNIVCLIIGDGPQRNNLEKLSKKLSLQNSVMFLGHRKFSETISILKVLDIFVNPSYTEGLPTTVIEAALCRKAIIATNVGGTSEIITNNESGYLIKVRNATILSLKLKQLIENQPLREKMGNSAFQEVKNKFNWNLSAQKYLELFTNIIAGE